MLKQIKKDTESAKLPSRSITQSISLPSTESRGKTSTKDVILQRQPSSRLLLYTMIKKNMFNNFTVVRETKTEKKTH